MRLENDNIVYEKHAALEKWKQDFFSIYNPLESQSDVDPDTFKTNEYSGIDKQGDLNSPITFDECRRVIFLAKLRKAVGIDCLPNEVFKNEPSVLLLNSLFNEVFSLYGQNQL